ncbi:MAG: hypothetical protein ATN31_08610 [Candidatus Epulonipiscioides saccharophilum]|nr:MAG: hypothetical protein ATN31_08610 [Epulopiscium sp. AS2M-Bin001]
MIKHIVFVKVKEESKSRLEEFKNLLLSMKENISQIRHLEVGINIKSGAVYFDIAAEICFDSLEDLDIYLKHPFHAVDVMNFIKEVNTSIAVVDYEI